MDSQEDWRGSLGFADRYGVIENISLRIRTQLLDLPQAEINRQARAKEKEIYEQSLTREDYDTACASAVQEDGPEGEEEPYTISSDSDTSETHATSIGIYTHATHHRSSPFSFVFKARSSDTPSTLVALKVTTPSLTQPPHSPHREAHILRSLIHASVIQLLETFTQPQGRFVLVLPFMRLDLAKLLSSPQHQHQRRNPSTQNNANSIEHILRDLFSALEYIHSQGVIHRDIKPSNILLASPSGPAYLADFGIAWSTNDHSASEPADQKITDVGTTCYRPPELLFGDRTYSTGLDMWAAGCVVAEATSVLPSPGGTLFDAGDLGSELALIQSMFTSLGTPTLATWPEAARLPDWGKMAFRQFPGRSWDELMPGAAVEAKDLVGRLVKFESGQRANAAAVLKLEYFEGLDEVE